LVIEREAKGELDGTAERELVQECATSTTKTSARRTNPLFLRFGSFSRHFEALSVAHMHSLPARSSF